nr:GNAT family N-acetyltransferase [Lachnospiraceae bacterium]
MGVEVTRDMFVLAKEEEARDILEFYHSFIGQEGCTWSEDYPTMEHVQSDIEKDNLFLIRDERGIVATISIDSDEQVDVLPNWTVANAREAARLGVRKDVQGCGVARKMLLYLMQTLSERGFEGIHFLVSPDNAAALASYDRLHFENRGNVYLYDHDWFCYEKRIKE